MNADKAAALSLLSADAVRTRAHRLLAIGLRDELPHFQVHLDYLDRAIDLVLASMAKNYPAGNIPFHARWRHFEILGVDRWALIADAINWPNPAARARAEFDLAIVSVLLDAGAGPAWRYHDKTTGKSVGRSEGLALASLDMFAAGSFSSHNDKLRADADKLSRLTIDDLRLGFQVTVENPLVGLEGRVVLLRQLGELLARKDGVFARGDGARPGFLFDHLSALAKHDTLHATTILSEVLCQFGPIWPSRILLGDVPLGDCWRHASFVTDDATNGLVPLHKLSQWLTYSLIEPTLRAGIAVNDVDGLTGLAEYRNGGLFVDTGVLSFRHEADATRDHEVGSALVVEWRALTVALLDRLAEILRRRLETDDTALPLAKILEGGTWAAGRAVAFERCPDGSPPVKVISDGTVF